MMKPSKEPITSSRLKKILLSIVLFFFIVSAFVSIRFGSTLFQEGNPAPILYAIIKLEVFDRDYVPFSETDRSIRYVSENQGGQDRVKEWMKEKGWAFKEQLGSGLIFVKGEESLAVSTVQFSKHFILWDVPVEIVKE